MLVVLSFPAIGVAGNITVNRVLSLGLCTDWLLAHYADRKQVLALSPLIKKYPGRWSSLDWPVHDGSLEQILTLQPDLVLASEYAGSLLRQRLKSLGIRVEVLNLPHNLDQMAAYEQRFLALLGLPVNHASVAPVEVEAGENAPSLLLLGANGIGTGRNTFEDGIIEHAGWRNYLAEEQYTHLDLEQIIRQPPDAVLWAVPTSAARAYYFSEHPALQQVIPAHHWLTTDAWRWRCPGPWTWKLVEQLQQ